jgi:hypothetical protein
MRFKELGFDAQTRLSRTALGGYSRLATLRGVGTLNFHWLDLPPPLKRKRKKLPRF